MSEHPKIVVRPPGPKAREIVKRDETLISSSYSRYYPLVVESGEGCIVRDVDGNEYIDFNSGLLRLNVGQLNPRVVYAIKDQCDKLLHYSCTDFYYQPIVDLSERICKITPGSFEKKAYFGNSGGEAVEAAIKLAKWHTRKHQFISFIGDFHGRTLGALALTGKEPVHRKHFFPMVPGITHVPFPYCYRCPFKLSQPECDYWCVDFIDEFVLQKFLPPEEVAAVFFEPIQGEGGFVVPPQEFFRRLKGLADKYGLLLIDDEVQSGMGRTGRWFSIEHWKIEPDVVCVGNSVGSGIPLSATVARSNLMDWEGGSHSNPSGGNPLACAAALAVIDVIEEDNLLENAVKQGNRIMRRLRTLMSECEIIGDVRGMGLMIGTEIVEDKKSKKPRRDLTREIMLRCWKRGITLVTDGASTLRIAPPLTITEELVDKALRIIEDVIKEVNEEKD